MTIDDLHDLNEKFQKSAVQLSELIPTGGLTEASSIIIRSARNMHAFLGKMIQVNNEVLLGSTIEKIEYHIDEIIFVLDQLDIANKKQRISLVSDFLKQGYDLLSIYSMCVDQIIKEKIPSEE